jgi:hypothetical protein
MFLMVLNFTSFFLNNFFTIMCLEKNILRHEILNMFTVLKGIVEQEDFSPENILLMNQYIEASTLLVEYEHLLLEDSKEFLSRPFPLQDALEGACELASDITGCAHPRCFLEASPNLRGDKHHFQRALGYILARHMLSTNTVTLSYYEEDGALHIQCIPPFEGDVCRKKMKDSLSVDDIFFQTAIRILEAMRMKTISCIRRIVFSPKKFCNFFCHFSWRIINFAIKLIRSVFKNSFNCLRVIHITQNNNFCFHFIVSNHLYNIVSTRLRHENIKQNNIWLQAKSVLNTAYSFFTYIYLKPFFLKSDAIQPTKILIVFHN